MKKLSTIIAGAGVGMLALSACGQEGTPEAETGGSGEAPEYTVAEDVDLSDSPTWTAANEAGTLTIGVKKDQPGLGNQGPGADVPEGFDIEMAKIVAGSLGFAPDQIEWTETVSANREPFLQQGNVDMVVATYTINDERKEVVDFAGPYYVAGQDLLVA
ncbi:MAG TPA: transporter substrate-binding domain-containing protein, partial [Brevibacterium sp.]|nr:transporter substrate-binding domain-containing protein [Brevibacterium sp.]